jgi:hypothetical protein
VRPGRLPGRAGVVRAGPGRRGVGCRPGDPAGRRPALTRRSGAPQTRGETRRTSTRCPAVRPGARRVVSSAGRARGASGAASAIAATPRGGRPGRQIHEYRAYRAQTAEHTVPVAHAGRHPILTRQTGPPPTHSETRGTRRPPVARSAGEGNRPRGERVGPRADLGARYTNTVHIAPIPARGTLPAARQLSSTTTTRITTTSTIPASAGTIGRWRHQNSGWARSRVWWPSGGVPTQSSSSQEERGMAPSSPAGATPTPWGEVASPP